MVQSIRFITAAVCSCVQISEAARIAKDVLAMETVEDAGYTMFEDVATPLGFFEATANSSSFIQLEVDPKTVLCPSFPKNLESQYSNIRMAGTGATACVYLGDKNGVSVAVKVAKMDGKFSSFRRECSEMQDLRKAACSQSKEFLQLAQNFVPTCLEVGEETAGGKAFFTMHAAGTKGISKSERVKRNIGFDVPQQKKAFAQMVAAVYGLHGIGFAHNDLHGNNIVFDADDELALIDFGDVTPAKIAYTGAGLKRDGNAIWRWGASLAGCKDFTFKYLKTPKSKQDEPRAKILACVRDAWSMDDASLSAFGDVVLASSAQKSDQKLGPLYKSAFVQANLPPLKNTFPWDETKGCLNWDWDKIDKTWEIKECTVLPKYAGQCKIDVHPGGCFKEGAGDWGCFPPGNAKSPAGCRAKGYAGSCMHSEHGKVLTEKEVPVCKANCIERCTAEEKVGMWGACFIKNNILGITAKQQCGCVPTVANGGAPLKYLKRACSTQQIGTKNRAYEALCKLPESKFVDAPTKKTYARIVRTVGATTTTTAPDRALLKSEVCQCQTTDTVNGKSTGGRVGCDYHLTKNFGKFCYISGGTECLGSKFSNKLQLHWRKCR